MTAAVPSRRRRHQRKRRAEIQAAGGDLYAVIAARVGKPMTPETIDYLAERAGMPGLSQKRPFATATAIAQFLANQGAS